MSNSFFDVNTLYSYLYKLTGLNIMIAMKTPFNHTPEIKEGVMVNESHWNSKVRYGEITHINEELHTCAH